MFWKRSDVWTLHIYSKINSTLIYVTFKLVLFCVVLPLYLLFRLTTVMVTTSFARVPLETRSSSSVRVRWEKSLLEVFCWVVEQKSFIMNFVSILAHRWGSPSRNQPMRSQCSSPHCLEEIGLESRLSKGQWENLTLILTVVDKI